MTRVHKSGLPLATHIRPLSEAALKKTIAEPARVAQLDLFAEKIDRLDFLIWFATEEMKAVTPDMVADLIAAHWNISTGYYKTAASSLRSALDVGVTGLYFFCLHDKLGNPEPFEWWSTGAERTPNWNQYEAVFKQVPEFTWFNDRYACDLVDDVHKFFIRLSSYTHSRPFMEFLKRPTNYQNLVGDLFPGFEPEAFRTLLELANRTIEYLAMMWLVGFPELIVAAYELDKFHDENPVSPSAYYPLVSTPLGRDAIDFAFSFIIDRDIGSVSEYDVKEKGGKLEGKAKRRVRRHTQKQKEKARERSKMERDV